MRPLDSTHRIDEDLLRKYDRPGPRYTSYPTAPLFDGSVDERCYAAALEGVDGRVGVSLYLHVPFCERRCTYCGCFVIPTRRREVGEAYALRLQREIELVRERIPGTVRVDSIHLGGGTPTYLAPSQLEAVISSARTAFPVDASTEIAIEVDPRVTTIEHLEALVGVGVNRVSLGVQDADDEVQAAIGRGQTWEETERAFHACREVGLDRINVDLVYGLPQQTTVSFARTLRSVIRLGPDRLAVFGYAHVPTVRSNQRSIDASTLPDADARLHLLAVSHEQLSAAGYLHIGLDHWALPQDELALAQSAGVLGRGFMGYTPRRETMILGFGVSSIGDVGNAYFQNEKKLARYYERIDRGELPIERGWLLSTDDRIRRYVILEVLCNLGVDFSRFEMRFGVPFREYFERERQALFALEADGLIELHRGGLRITERGRLLLRNIAMVFDAYLAGRGSRPTPIYSRTV